MSGDEQLWPDMDISAGSRWPSSALSNFAPHPFTVRGERCASMEGFLQSLKFQNVEMAAHVRTLTGRKAKHKGKHKNWQRTQTLYWNGKPIDRHSDEYQELLDDAYHAMFTQNAGARKALLATGSATLTHSIGGRNPSSTVLTRTEFTGRLTRIRADLASGNLSPQP